MRFVTDEGRVLHGTDSIKVIVAGLPRCATSSLQAAMEQDLGFGPCMHMAYIAPHTHLLKLVNEALLETDKARRQKILHRIFDGYVATADFPGMCFVDDLIEMYPDAQIVLNTRESGERWLSSITNTLKFFSTSTYLVICGLWPSDYWHHHLHQSIKRNYSRRFGFGDGPDSIFILRTYQNHNQWVRDVAKQHGKTVLEWRPTDGWPSLCKFLDRPVPDKPFPHVNDESFIKMLIYFLVLRGLLAWAALLSSPVLAYWAWMRVMK